jgi:AraC family transcriptional regulator
MRLYREFLRDDTAAPLAIEGLALEILAEGWRRAIWVPGSGPPPWLARVHEVVHHNFAEPFTLAELAAQARVHPVHMAAAFRRHYGCTIGEFVRRRRIEVACRALTTCAASIAEIALTVGFADQSHFSRTFKRLTGLTPAAYRKTSGRP